MNFTLRCDLRADSLFLITRTGQTWICATTFLTAVVDSPASLNLLVANKDIFNLTFG